MTTTEIKQPIEIKRTMIELSNEEKEILYKTVQILNELDNEDSNNNIFCSILEEQGCDLSDFYDIAEILEVLCKKDVLYN